MESGEKGSRLAQSHWGEKGRKTHVQQITFSRTACTRTLSFAFTCSVAAAGICAGKPHNSFPPLLLYLEDDIFFMGFCFCLFGAFNLIFIPFSLL